MVRSQRLQEATTSVAFFANAPNVVISPAELRDACEACAAVADEHQRRDCFTVFGINPTTATPENIRMVGGLEAALRHHYGGGDRNTPADCLRAKLMAAFRASLL